MGEEEGVKGWLPGRTVLRGDVFDEWEEGWLPDGTVLGGDVVDEGGEEGVEELVPVWEHADVCQALQHRQLEASIRITNQK